MALIKKQFCDYQRAAWKSAKGDAEQQHFAAWMQSLTADGNWPDVDYADQTRSAWRAMTHLNRVKSMCMVYTSPTATLYHDPALAKTIHSALGYWLQKDYRNPNWWHNEIGVPQELSIIMLLLDAELSPQERADGIKIISRSVIDSPPHGGRGVLTGQNRVWVAANALTHGLLASDSDLVRHARQVIFEEVAISTMAGGWEPKMTRAGPGDMRLNTQDGIQPDFSFFQHGPLLQLGNYGLGFAGDMVMWLTVLRDTSLAVDQDKVGIIRDYLLNGESTVVWKGAMDINSCGRQIGPKSAIGKGQEILRILGVAKVADAAHAAEYQAAIDQDSGADTATTTPAKLTTASNTYFWRADFMVHRRRSFYVSTRMSSSRVFATEFVNGENRQGTYLGDGATYVYVTGHEYDDIFPVWDWSRLPGVTCPRITDKKLLQPKNFSATNTSDFVGGASDGQHGAAALALNRDGLVAKKAWFFFDDQIVCLGAGITCDKDSTPITTSINQCLANGPITLEAGDGPATPPTDVTKGVANYSHLKWALHDNVGYVFPEPLNITLGSQVQTGSWNDVYTSGKHDPITQNVFSIWINHGSKPQEDHYSYLILPTASRASVEAQSHHPDVAILKNTSALQAVRDAGLKMTEAVFYQPGALTYDQGNSISVDQPCIVLLNENTKRLTLADPTQKLTDITVTRNGMPTKFTLPAVAQAGSSFSTF